MRNFGLRFATVFFVVLTSSGAAHAADDTPLAQAKIRIEGFENAPETPQDRLLVSSLNESLTEDPDYKGQKKGEISLLPSLLCPKRKLRYQTDYSAVLEATKVNIVEDDKGVRHTHVEITFGPSQLDLKVSKDEPVFCVDSTVKGRMELGQIWLSLEIFPTAQDGRIPELDLKSLRFSELQLKDLGLNFAGIIKWESKQDPKQFSAWLEKNLNKVIAELLMTQFKQKIEEGIRKAIEKYLESED